MGLSLISMVINLIQIKIVELNESAADFFEEELGWDTESETSGDDEPNNKEETASRPQHNPSGVTLGVFSTNITRSSSQHSGIDQKTQVQIAHSRLTSDNS